MAEENIQQTENVETETITSNEVSNALVNSLLGENVTKQAPAQQDNTASQQAAQSSTPAAAAETGEETELLEPNAYLKNKWGFDSEEIADAEIKALRELKEKGSEYKYKNDESKKIAEYINNGEEDKLLEHLYTKRQLSKLSKADLTDEKIASELVKFGIKQDNLNSNLSDDDVDFLFNQKYSYPSKPVQDSVETDEDYALRIQTWETQVQNVKRAMVIEAKIQQPKLAQLNTELVLPEIKKESRQQQPQLSQKDLDDFKKLQESFIEHTQKSVKDFSGFSQQVKDKDVDYTVGYTPSAEEKTLVETKLKQFAESGFDVNVLLRDLWVSEDGKTINVERMQKDLFALYTGEKAQQKMINDAANKRLEIYLKGKKQINVNETRQQGTFNPQQPKNEQEVLTDAWLSVR